MRLLRLGVYRWEVLAIVAEDGESCAVLDFLLEPREGQQAMRRAMYSFLKETVTRHGPQEQNTEVCLRLRPHDLDLYEFRKQPKRGQKIRVLWFYDEEGCRIVCVNGFLKTDKTPPKKVREAIEERERYFRDKAYGDLIVEDF